MVSQNVPQTDSNCMIYTISYIIINQISSVISYRCNISY